jgi:hypothetical protein
MPTRLGPSGPRGELAACGVEQAGAGVGLGLMGRNPKKILFWIKIKFLNIPRLWKFAQRDLGGILTWGFFLNSSRLLKYFRKMEYAMSCYATLGKIN